MQKLMACCLSLLVYLSLSGCSKQVITYPDREQKDDDIATIDFTDTTARKLDGEKLPFSILNYPSLKVLPGEHVISISLNLFDKSHHFKSEKETSMWINAQAGHTYEVNARLLWGKRWRPTIIDRATGELLDFEKTPKPKKQYISEEKASENTYVVRIPYEVELNLKSVGTMLARAVNLCLKDGYTKIAATPYISNNSTHEIKAFCINSKDELPEDLRRLRPIDTTTYLDKAPQKRTFPLSLSPPM